VRFGFAARREDLSASDVITRAAVWALRHFFDAADRTNRDHEENCDEAHALFQDELRCRSTSPATHRLRRQFIAPNKELRADDNHGKLFYHAARKNKNEYSIEYSFLLFCLNHFGQFFFAVARAKVGKRFFALLFAAIIFNRLVNRSRNLFGCNPLHALVETRAAA